MSLLTPFLDHEVVLGVIGCVSVVAAVLSSLELNIIGDV